MKKIAQFILNSPHKVVNMNSQDIAEVLDTSPSSIIRFSKKITEGGFHELKIGLSKFLPKEASVYNVELVDNENTDSLKRKCTLVLKVRLTTPMKKLTIRR